MAGSNTNKAPRGSRAAQQGAKSPAAPDEQRSTPPSGSNTSGQAGDTGPLEGQLLLPGPQGDQPLAPLPPGDQSDEQAATLAGGTGPVADLQQPSAQGGDIEGYWIRSVPESIRRAGRRFTQEGAGYALDLFSEEELEQLLDEPNLVVERCTFTDEGVVSR